MAEERLYVISLSSAHSLDAVKVFLDSKPVISKWFISLPFCIFVRSSLSAKQIWQMLENQFGSVNILVSEITSNYYGRLPKEHWEYFPPTSNII